MISSNQRCYVINNTFFYSNESKNAGADGTNPEPFVGIVGTNSGQ